MNAHELLERLEARHSKDVFVAECKMGETWGSGRRILDAWALRKTWRPLTTIGYEVKVRRSDFLHDQKWQEYLPACHEFYFVTPRGVIDPRELPQDIGLLWPAGQRLQTKRKAVRREPDPESVMFLMAYLLMSRSRIVANMLEANGPDRLEFWRNWLLEDTGETWLGHMIGRRLRERVDRAEEGRRAAERKAEAYERIRQRMVELGLDPDQPLVVDDLQRRLDGDVRLTALRQVMRLSERATEIAREAVE